MARNLIALLLGARSTRHRYLFAFGAAGCCLALSWVIDPYFEHAPVMLPIAAALVALVYGGVVPGIITSVAAGLAVDYFLIPPVGFTVFTAIRVTVVTAMVVAASVLRLAYERAENRRVELALVLSQRDEFLAIASHELKTPLTVLRLELQRLSRRLGALPFLDDLRRLDRRIERVSQLIDGVLDASAALSGPLILEREDADLVALVQRVVERHRDELADGGCALRVVMPGGPLTGRWDVARVEQVLSKLLANAAKFGRGAPVTVTVSGDEKVARVLVEDAGVGISLADQERIFGRFPRGGVGNSHGGLGLGLWMAQQLAEAHGGRLAVRSELGQGARFELVLPRAQARVEVLPPPPEKPDEPRVAVSER